MIRKQNRVKISLSQQNFGTKPRVSNTVEILEKNFTQFSYSSQANRITRFSGLVVTYTFIESKIKCHNVKVGQNATEWVTLIQQRRNKDVVRSIARCSKGVTKVQQKFDQAVTRV